MTGAELEVKRQREERLQDTAERAERPVLWYGTYAWNLMRILLAFMPLGIAGLLIASMSWGNDPSQNLLAFLDHRGYYVALGAFVFFFPDVVKRIGGWLLRKGWHLLVLARDTRRLRRVEAARSAERASRESAPADSFAGIAITTIADGIAAREDGRLTRELLVGMGLKEDAAKRLQGVLKNGRYLVYPASLKPDAPALGAEPIAAKDPRQSRSTTLSPHLLTVSVPDRARVIANAIRKAGGLTPEGDPRIIVDALTVLGQPMSAIGHATQERADA